jgi:hypothetical protein
MSALARGDKGVNGPNRGRTGPSAIFLLSFLFSDFFFFSFKLQFEFKCCGELVLKFKIQNKHTMDRLYLFTYLLCIASFLLFSKPLAFII